MAGHARVLERFIGVTEEQLSEYGYKATEPHLLAAIKAMREVRREFVEHVYALQDSESKD